MKYLLDTNICIYIIKNNPPAVQQRFSKERSGDVAISSITVAELYYGAEKSSQVDKNIISIQKFLQPLIALHFSEEDAVAYGRVRADLERQGAPIGAMDLLIAAQALSHELILVTNNVREFQRIASLRIENWAAV